MITIDKITTTEALEWAFEIRKKVFVIEQQVDPAEEYDEFEVVSTHYLAFQDGHPVGTARWRTTDQGVKLERFAVLEGARNEGVGTHLVKRCLQDIPKDQGKIYLHAQIQVIPFYELLGFEVSGEEFIEANIRHKKMIYKEA